MTPEVEAAVAEIRAIYGGDKVDVEPLPDGGARVIVRDIQLPESYAPAITWVGFVIGFQYPYADVYPHYVDSQLKRRDGSQLNGSDGNPTAFSTVMEWQGRSCIQVSRRSNRLDPATDTAALKLAKVLEFLRSL